MSHENLLLVEGNEDQHVVWHLTNAHGIVRGAIEVKPMQGAQNLLQALPLELRSDKTKKLGIVVDADTDLAGRWESIRNILISNRYQNVPAAPLAEGTVVELESLRLVRVPKVGVWVMPDNRTTGMLEDFVSFLGARYDPLWAVADGCLNEITAPRFKPSYRIKAHLHTWLAWQEEPGSPMALAITRTFLDAHAPHAERFIAWIRSLFDL